jgi:calcineurin-binding protein cabin-1
MEKLLEVLIAIRDEVACLSVANLILRSWPSHHRALHVKKTIECAEPVPFAPRGIDILEPKHVTLVFSNKRKSLDDEIYQETKTKKSKQSATLQLNEAKWLALLDGILSFLSANSEKADENNCINANEGTVRGFAYNTIDVVVSADTIKSVESAGENGNDSHHDSESVPSHDCKTTVKEKDINSDREHTHERRSTRLERLRSRKSGKDENGSDGKDISHAVTQFLDSFILKGANAAEKADFSGNADASNPDALTYTSDDEANDFQRFLCKISKNFGPHHIGHMLLEEMTHLKVPFQDYFVKLIELDRLTRGWAEDRSELCSLFLAELYYDRALCSGSPSTSSELSDSSYHLCKIIESVALELPFNTSGREIHSTDLDLEMESSREDVSSSGMTEKSNENSAKPISTDMLSDKKSECDSSSNMNCAFWIRFFWLSGCLSLSSDCKEKAYKEFNIALSILRNGNKDKSCGDFILLPHTKLVKSLTTDRILREINLIRLESLLWNNDENINKITHTEFMKLLPPLLLSTKDVYVGNAYGPQRESENVISLELSALDVLISACEKARPMNIQVYLDSHRRKIQVLTVAAGMVGSVTPSKEKGSSNMDFVEAMNRNRLENVVEAVKDVSRNASKAKDFIDQCDNSVSWTSHFPLISFITHLTQIFSL